MNKAEFVDLVKKVGEYDTKKDAEKAVAAVLSAVEEALFGKFETAVQKAKSGKVPGTNKTYTTKEKAVPKFRPGKGLKDEVAKAKK